MGSKLEAHQDRIFNRIMVVAPAAAGIDEADLPVETERRLVGGAHLEKNLNHVSRAKFGGQAGKEPACQAAALELGSNGDGFQLRLGRQ